MKYTHKYRDMLCKGTLLVAAVLATVWVTLPAIAYEFPEDGATVTGTIDEMQVVLSSREVTFDAVTASGIIEPTYSGAVIENLGTATITQGSTFTGNSAPSGGVVYNTGNLTVVDSHFGAVGAGNVAANGGAILNTGNATVGGTFTENTASGWGGAIYNSGNLTIADGTTFTNNTAGSVGGAITNALGTSVLTLGADVSFTGNEAVNDGGAIGNYKGAALVNGTTFTSNRAQTGTNDTDAIGGGAMSLGAESTIQIANATFTSNTSGFNGGALGTRNAWSADNSAASLDVSNSTFTGNKALGTVTSTFKNGTIISTGGNGGALDNHFYNSNAQAGYAYVTGSTFTGNEAVNGGAIYNNGVEDAAGNIAKLYVTGSTFTGNTATTDGGAIYNGGELVLAGTNTFSGNTASSIANDIYNAGTLTIDGTTSLDGGIAGTGIVNVNGILNIDMASVQANELNFANGSTLGVTFANSTMGNLNAATIHVDTTANLVVTLARDFLTTDTTENTLAETDITGGNFVL
ncbi:MAG: hypothetical protein MJ053_03915, partial [Elusimicrobiaceae bacterium]|nr:hypothetical protein [Elusimicrobiaceae bacterium]